MVVCFHLNKYHIVEITEVFSHSIQWQYLDSINYIILIVQFVKLEQLEMIRFCKC